MTVSEKHIASAYEILIAAGAEYFNTFYDEGEPGELYENGLVAIIAPHVASALAAAEREGMRRATEIASQCGIDAIDFAKKHIGEHHTDFQRFQDGCEASSAAIRKQVNTHSVALPPPSATEAGSVQPSADPATHHASRNGDG